MLIAVWTDMKVDPAKYVLKEAFVESEKSYSKRVFVLALFYGILFVVSISGLFVLVTQVKLYVALAQRSNVETLTLAFFGLFFTYIGVVSFPGAWGAVKIIYCNCVWGKEKEVRRERRKISLLKSQRSEVSVALSHVLAHQGKPFEIPIEDGYGSLGKLHFDGARISHTDYFADGSNTLFSFVVVRIQELKRKEGKFQKLKIVEWEKIDDEETAKYLGQVDFARRLQDHLGVKLWPEISLSAEDISQLEKSLNAICPSLRSEALLPDWEYEGEHKIPVIPEPLGIISLSRQEKRVDPVTAMGAVLVILILALGTFVLFIFHPPWVPGV